MRPPRSLRAQITTAACDAVIAGSSVVAHYASDVDPESAKELLGARLAQAAQAAQAEQAAQPPPTLGQRRTSGSKQAAPDGGFDVGDAAKIGVRVLTSSTTNTLLRGLFGVLTGTSARRRRR